MRSGALAVALLCVAGCYDDPPGVTLVIKDPGHGAVKVELFIATRSADADSLAPDKARANEARGKLRGDSFFLDGPRDGVTPITELPIVDGQVVWTLQADPDGPRKVKVLAAIAYDEQGAAVAMTSMRDFEIPPNTAKAYVLNLEAATQIAPSDSMEPAGVRVWPWRKQGAPATAACLALEHSDGADHLRRLWLVPEDDPDCDEVEVECDGHFWHADDTRNSNNDPECFNGTQLGMDDVMTACRVGSRTCVDGTPPGSCVPSSGPQYCVANALCNPEICTANPLGCTSALDTTSIKCEFLLSNLGVQCDDGNEGGPMVVNLRPLFPNGCSSVAFVGWDVLGTGLAPTPTHLDVFHDATFKIDQLEPGLCSFVLSMDGSVDFAASPMLLLALDVTLVTDHVLVPLLVHTSGTDCSQRSTCGVSTVMGEGLERCH